MVKEVFSQSKFCFVIPWMIEMQKNMLRESYDLVDSTLEIRIKKLFQDSLSINAQKKIRKYANESQHFAELSI